jgi:hypothetical protein
MAKNFLDEDISKVHVHHGYIDGFRFGFGFFIAWLLGMSILALIVAGVIAAANQLRG